MIRLYIVLIVTFLPILGFGQQEIESTNVEFKMMKNGTDRIILNSGPPFLFPLPPYIQLNDIFGKPRITIAGNDFYKYNNPYISLTGNVELDSTYTMFKLNNELGGGSWGLGLGSYWPNNNSFDITLNKESKFSIREDGNVYIDNLSENGTRPLFVDNSGRILAKGQFTAKVVIPYSEFTARDGDGALVKIVTPGENIDFVQHKGDITDEGELVAAINLPNQALVHDISICFINEASTTNVGSRFQIAFDESRIQQRLTNSQNNIPFHTIPIGGQIQFNAFGNNIDVACTSFDVFNIRTNYATFMYNVIVKCEDCSNQYIRSVSVSYSH